MHTQTAYVTKPGLGIFHEHGQVEWRDLDATISRTACFWTVLGHSEPLKPKNTYRTRIELIEIPEPPKAVLNTPNHLKPCL